MNLPNWQLVVGGSMVTVFVIAFVIAMATSLGLTLLEIAVGFSVVVFVAAGVVLFAKGLVDYLDGD